MLMFTLDISCLTTSNLPWFMDLTFLVPMQHCSLQKWTLLLSPVPPTNGCYFALTPSLHSFWSFFSTDLQWHIGHLLTWWVHLSVSYLFTFSYCSWGSQGRNPEVVCHSLLQWTSLVATVPRGHKRIRHKLVTKNLYLGGYLEIWPNIFVMGSSFCIV